MLWIQNPIANSKTLFSPDLSLSDLKILACSCAAPPTDAAHGSVLRVCVLTLPGGCAGHLGSSSALCLAQIIQFAL